MNLANCCLNCVHRHCFAHLESALNLTLVLVRAMELQVEREANIRECHSCFLWLETESEVGCDRRAECGVNVLCECNLEIAATSP